MKIPLKEYILLLSKYLKPYMNKVILLMLLLAASVGLQLINPQIVRYFIDAAKEGAAGKYLIGAALAFIGISLAQQVFAVASTYISQDVGWSSTNALREDLLKHCIDLDMSFHKSKQPGELLERVDGDVSSLFNFFSKLMFNLINNLALLFGTLIILFLEDWRVGLGLSTFVFTAIIALIRIQPIAVKHWTKERETNAKFYGFIGENISCAEDIKSSGAFHSIMYKFYEYLRKWYPIQRKAVIMGYSMWISVVIIFALGNIVAFGIGGYLWLKGIVTIGTVYLIFYYTELLNRPIEQIRFQLQDLQVAGASIARVKELFAIQSKLKEGRDVLLCKGPISINVQNLSFEYEPEVPVLDDISFELKPGEVMGLLGRTGSGKTTLARLIVRLFDPISGELYIDNKLISSIQTKYLREQIAYVTQDVQLFKATIRQNLTLFNAEISDEEIQKSIREIGLGQWIESLPEGLDTILDSSGGGLSAGEAQLLAFVRVFLRNPSLIILDEASSRLDPITEQLVERAIDKLLENRTCIIIAHRISTVKRADSILILEDGKIAEKGERAALIADKTSRFSKLLEVGIEEVLV
ncbi:MAG TPA: ABC transporter ATP-binding protein [Patescibacteria group bacterium]|nr:ABC transporter ATP-binding protein [Patescibacteria group bacterium]